jgi:hypothetical protein
MNLYSIIFVKIKNKWLDTKKMIYPNQKLQQAR